MCQGAPIDKTTVQLLGRVLTIFAIGFFVTSGALALMSVGDCGSVFDPSGACDDGQLAGRQAMVVAFLGLGLTGLVAAAVVPLHQTSPGE